MSHARVITSKQGFSPVCSHMSDENMPDPGQLTLNSLKEKQGLT